MGFSIAHMGFTSRKSRKKGRVTRGLLCVSPVLAACVTYESGMVAIMDFPHEDKPVWVLGRQYNLRRERHEAQCDVRSRLWMTYRKGFSHIGKCYDIVEVLITLSFAHEDKPLWVLGRQYNLRRERHEAQCDVRSRLWMTCRKGFLAYW